MHYSNIVIKTRARWVGYNPLSNDYFTEAIELGSEIDWKDYIHLVIEDKQSGAVDLIKTIDNLLTEGVHNGLGESNWMKLWMHFARTHLQLSYPALAKHGNDLNRLVQETCNLVNHEGE